MNDYCKFEHKILQLPLHIDNIELKLQNKANTRKIRKKINNYENIIHISTIYQNHKDIVLELIQKREIYPDSYIDDLLNQYEGTLFNNREDILRLITCGYVEDRDLHKRPLSKLIKDISQELELL